MSHSNGKPKMKAVQLNTRIADESDLKDIWEWRNDVKTRKMFLTASKVSFDEHQKWYSEILSRKSSYLYIGIINAKDKIGVCRFDLGESCEEATISININPKYRGRGFCCLMLLSAIDSFQKERHLNLRANIKKENKASIKCFQKCGFNLISENEHQLLFERFFVVSP